MVKYTSPKYEMELTEAADVITLSFNDIIVGDGTITNNNGGSSWLEGLSEALDNAATK